MALVLAWAALTFVGLPSENHVGVGAFATWPGHAQDAAQAAGIKTGDRIMAIDGRAIKNDAQLISTVEQSSGLRLTLLVNRDGHDVTLHATPVDGRTIKSGKGFLTTGKKAHGYLGISLVDLPVRDSWFAAIPSSFTEVGSLVGTAATAIVHLPATFKSLVHQVASPAAANNPTNQRTRPESIVGVVRIAVQSTSTGPGDLLIILMAVNIFVGVLNMLPMLPLDGGYVAISTYERIRTRRGRRRYEADLNKMVPFAYAFMGVLLFLFACTLYLDIAHPIANPF
jgi:membrane-associated protease RseP (regulator of RpoE activity)